MRESFGLAYVVNFVIIFIIIFIFFFVAGISYTKAFKVKNRIVDIIEENEGYNNTAERKIKTILSQVGYRIEKGHANKCSEYYRGSGKPELLTSTASDYDYCVYRITTKSRGDYYQVVAFMYFDLPLGFGTMKFPVYGQTKLLGKY